VKPEALVAVRGSRCSRKRRSTGYGTHRWKASRVSEARCVRSAARGRGSRCSPCGIGAVRSAGGRDRGLSARRSSRLTHGQKSRRRLVPGKAGPPRRGKVIMRCSWWWDSHSRHCSRLETPLTRLSGAVADGTVSSPARRCGLRRDGAESDRSERRKPQARESRDPAGARDNWLAAETDRRHLLRGERAGLGHASGRALRADCGVARRGGSANP
jgi:hypothetical protein